MLLGRNFKITGVFNDQVWGVTSDHALNVLRIRRDVVDVNLWLSRRNLSDRKIVENNN